jgi:hypothetical protein
VMHHLWGDALGPYLLGALRAGRKRAERRLD